jgi:hypothetical protein
MNSAIKSGILITAHGKMINRSLTRTSYLQVKEDLLNNISTDLIIALLEEYNENVIAHNDDDCIL